jgi:DNA topoisomerase II
VDVDPEKAFQKLTDVKKFDYLLGMSMWMLTEEKKNELLKQRDHRLSELRILKAKTEKNLWVEDLDALSKKLEEVEDKERKDDMEFLKKQAKNAAAKKAAAGGRGAKKTFGKGDETKPSKDGYELEFKVTADMIKKYEKEGQPKKERVKKEKGVAAKAGAGDGVDEPIDEFDALVEGGAPKVKKEPVKREPKAKKEPKPKGEKKADGMKQTKLKFPKKKKAGSSDEDDAVDLSGDSDMEFSATVAPREDRPGRRSASKVKLKKKQFPLKFGSYTFWQFSHFRKSTTRRCWVTTTKRPSRVMRSRNYSITIIKRALSRK